MINHHYILYKSLGENTHLYFGTHVVSEPDSVTTIAPNIWAGYKPNAYRYTHAKATEKCKELDCEMMVYFGEGEKPFTDKEPTVLKLNMSLTDWSIAFTNFPNKVYLPQTDKYFKLLTDFFDPPELPFYNFKQFDLLETTVLKTEKNLYLIEKITEEIVPDNIKTGFPNETHFVIYLDSFLYENK
jgi:hypothetical protein